MRPNTHTPQQLSITTTRTCAPNIDQGLYKGKQYGMKHSVTKKRRECEKGKKERNAQEGSETCRENRASISLVMSPSLPLVSCCRFFFAFLLLLLPLLSFASSFTFIIFFSLTSKGRYRVHLDAVVLLAAVRAGVRDRVISSPCPTRLLVKGHDAFFLRLLVASHFATIVSVAPSHRLGFLFFF